jgi:lysophosphatidate acyltransferase
MSTTLYILYFFSAYLLLTLTLFLLSYRGSTSASFFARLLASYLALTVATSYGVFVSIFLRLVGLGRSSQWAAGRAFAWMMAWAVGVRFVVEGKEVLKGTRPAVFVGNHQSCVLSFLWRAPGAALWSERLMLWSRELDVLMLGTIFPKHCAVTAKKSLRHIPILGWFSASFPTMLLPPSRT